MIFMKKVLTRVGIFLALVCILAFSTKMFFGGVQKPPATDLSEGVSKSIQSVLVGTTTVSVELAQTEEKIIRGLSGRESLLPDHGMLFVLPREFPAPFWMKEMNFPIDIIWISRTKRVVHIEHSLSPQTYPQTFAPTENALYVLEVPAGFSQSHAVRVGDPVIF